MQRRTDGKRAGGASAFLGMYTAMWALCALAVWLVFRLNHKSFLYIYDGMFQHFTSLEHVHATLTALLRGDAKSLSFFNLSLGQGADILTTLNSYDFTDPVCWLAALLPIPMMSRYVAMIFIKLYLVGLAFGVYCRETGRRDALYAALGAIAYAFSGATLMTVARHPNYINWAYCFPLMLAGGERYWRREKKGLLIAAVFLNLLISYYTFYMNAVMFAVWTVARAFCEWLRDRRAARARAEFAVCLKTAGVCLLGVMLAMVTLLPTLYAYSNNARFNVVTGGLQGAWHYVFTYYPRLVVCMFAAYMTPTHYTHIGMNTLIFPALILLFTRRERHTRVKAGLLVCLAALALPIAGRILNGFGYVSNRWSYAFVFAGCVALVDMLPRMREISRAEGWIIAALAVAFAGLAIIAPKNDAVSITWALLALMAVTVAVVLWVGRVKSRRLGAALLCGVVLLSALYQCVYTYAPGTGYYLRAYWPSDKIAYAFDEHSATAAAGLDEGFYRVEEQEMRANLNARAGVHGTDWWWSLLPSWMADYYFAFDMDTVQQNCRYYGLGGRTALLETASVKYYTAPAGEDEGVPYGYTRIETGSADYDVYENRYALPVGYAYAGYMLHSDYDGLSAVEKQMAQLQCAVVDAPIDGQQAIAPDTRTQRLDYEIVEAKDVELVEGGVLVKAEKGEIRLRTDVPEDCEVHVVLDDIRLPDDNSGNPETVAVEVIREDADSYLRKKGWMSHPTYQWPVVRDDLTFDMGSRSSGETTFTVRFSDECRLQAGRIELVAVPMRPYAEQAGRLQAAAMTDVEVGSDRLAGRLSLGAPGILQISVPYSKGWTARVDGEKAAILRSDDMYMALPLAAGEHRIELTYETPYLKLGAAISLLTLAGLAAWAILQKRRGGRAE